VNPTQVCTVSGGTGAVTSNGIGTVDITCVTQSFAVGGAVQGLLGSGLSLQDNGGDVLAVGANGPFTFAVAVDSDQPYVVIVKSQPQNPAQVCNVTAGSGTVTSAPVTSVLVDCATSQLSLIAGQLGGVGNIDGSGTGARFNQPHGVGIDASGNLYVADWNPSIRKSLRPPSCQPRPGRTQTSIFRVTSQSMAREISMSRTPATTSSATSVVVDPAGILYVADAGSIRKITAADGSVTTLVSQKFMVLSSLALDAGGNLYASDCRRAPSAR
jgi:hypothetical protein